MGDTELMSRARANGSSGGQYVAPGGRAANVDEVLRLLGAAEATAHTGVRLAAKALLDAMAARPWRVTAGAHPGGRGGGGRDPDENVHITVRIGGRGYHLQVTRMGHLRRITGDDHVEFVPPWLPPGAPVPRA